MNSVTKHFELLKIQLEAIKSATNNFADDSYIGQGGFGKVYKGELDHSKGRTMVAFKRLDDAFGQGNPEFWKEIIMLSIYKHENIVSLIGYCDESDEKILVYEYASNRSLDLYVSSKDITWEQRLKICIGAARGLAYLHDPGDTQQRVLHRDVKSSNILLDENWEAKISDLGLSKFGPANQPYTFLISIPVGTIGYCDPLYVETGLLTKESDVYSFGIVLFEVLCGRLCVDSNNDTRQPFTGLVRKCYKRNNMDEIIYADIKSEISPYSLKAFTTIAYQCLKRDREERPLMTKVVEMLESALKFQVGFSNITEPNIKNRETEDSVSYTVYFDKALKGKTGGNPNDPQDNREKSAVKTPPLSKPQTVAHQRGSQGAIAGREMKTSIESKNSFEAKVNAKGSKSPAYEGKKSYDNSLGTPARSRKKPTRGDESPDKGAVVPKFGEWDNKSSSVENYTHIFNKVREERVTGSPMVSGSDARNQKLDNKCFCFPWSK